MRTVVVEDRAKDEIKAAFFWYRNQEESAALAFYESLTRTIEILAESPKIAPLIDDRHRKFHIMKFPYNIIYREADETLFVVAVAHHSRRPDYWQLTN